MNFANLNTFYAYNSTFINYTKRLETIDLCKDIKKL